MLGDIRSFSAPLHARPYVWHGHGAVDSVRRGLWQPADLWEVEKQNVRKCEEWIRVHVRTFKVRPPRPSVRSRFFYFLAVVSISPINQSDRKPICPSVTLPRASMWLRCMLERV